MIKLRVITHSGLDEEVEVTEYKPEQLIEQLNSNQLTNVLIGRNIYSRIDVKHISEIAVE